MPRPKKSKLAALFIVAGAVFVGAVLWQVLPRSGFDSESTTDLENRLTSQRAQRERELRKELEKWRNENRALREEIERLEGRGNE